MLGVAAGQPGRPAKEELLRQAGVSLGLLSGVLERAIAMAQGRTAEDLCQNPKS
ncbi:MAG: hypothetical protein ABSH53_19150 [Holophaga sp.]|jgi:hypothetical protein